jgi:CBS domain containing-hemolysin-like protein
MVNFILGLLLSAAAIVFWTLLRTYQHVPALELKRLARSGDEVAQLLYQAVAYGMSLQLLLGMGVIVFAALALGCLTQAVGAWLAVFVLLILGLIGATTLVPAGELTRRSLWLARRAAPGVSWLLERGQPLFDGMARFVKRYRHVTVHTGLYEKTDLVGLLERQKGQPDSRISASEIDLLLHSLTFGDQLVMDALTPKRVLKTVAATETIGPILLDELSKSGHSRFPVYDQKHDNIVGVLYLHDLVGAHQSGRVADVMSRKLTYVHEDFTLHQTLQVFLKTKQHLFLVVNSFEELVGIITIEDVLEQMIGKQIVDEFDRYDDLRAVAAKAARKEHRAHHEPKPEAVPTAEGSEVVK